MAKLLGKEAVAAHVRSAQHKMRFANFASPAAGLHAFLDAGFRALDDIWHVHQGA
jgi:hypothetical protein